MLRSTGYNVRALLWSAVGMVISISSVVAADDQVNHILPDDRPKLEEQYRTARKTFADLIGGKITFVERSHQPTIDIMAQWYTYRFTWPEYQANVGGIYKNQGVANLMLEFESEFAKNKTAPARAVMEQFSHYLTVRGREVLHNDTVIARLNVARLLARVAATGSAEAGDVLAETLNQPHRKAAGVQYYAVQGLKGLLTEWYRNNPADALPQERQERVARYVSILLKVLQSPPPPSLANANMDEIDGWRVFRREIIRALTQTHLPAVTDSKGAIQERTAQVLLNVVARRGFVPEPRLDEQVEAAIGLTRMRSKTLPAYQPAYVADWLARFVVEMAMRFQAPEGRDKIEPFKYFASCLDEALDALQNDAKDLQDKMASAYLSQVVKLSQPVLKDIALDRKDFLNRTLPTLSQWLESHSPPQKTIYKGLDDSVVQPGGK